MAIFTPLALFSMCGHDGRRQTIRGRALEARRHQNTQESLSAHIRFRDACEVSYRNSPDRFFFAATADRRISESIVSDINGLWHPVKRCSFYPNFKELRYKR
jgi:hypothetical protein